MSLTRLLSALAGLPLLLALGCAASINPVMQQRAQQLAATRGNHDLGVPGDYTVPDWKEGSWLLQRTTTSDGRISVIRMSVLRANASGFLIQTDSQDDQQRMRTLAFYSGMPRKGTDAADLLLWTVQQTNDDAPVVSDFTDPSMAMMKGMFRAVTITAPSFEEVPSLPKEDVTGPAGRFAKAVRHDASVSMGPFRQDMVGWWHPGVPVSGMVKSQAPDGNHLSELLDFGWSGAVQVLQDPRTPTP